MVKDGSIDEVVGNEPITLEGGVVEDLEQQPVIKRKPVTLGEIVEGAYYGGVRPLAMDITSGASGAVRFGAAGFVVGYTVSGGDPVTAKEVAECAAIMGFLACGGYEVLSDIAYEIGGPMNALRLAFLPITVAFAAFEIAAADDKIGYINNKIDEGIDNRRRRVKKLKRRRWDFGFYDGDRTSRIYVDLPRHMVRNTMQVFGAYFGVEWGRMLVEAFTGLNVVEMASDGLNYIYSAADSLRYAAEAIPQAEEKVSRTVHYESIEQMGTFTRRMIPMGITLGAINYASNVIGNTFRRKKKAHS